MVFERAVIVVTFTRIISRSSAIPVAFARTRSTSVDKEPIASAGGARITPAGCGSISAGCGSISPSKPGGKATSSRCARSPGVRSSVERRDPSSDASSSAERRRVNWLVDSKGWSGWGEANAASHGVDAPFATSVQGLSVRWDRVVTDGVAAAPVGQGDGVRDCDFERVSRPLLEGSMVIIINYNSTSINCTSVVSRRLLEPEEAAVRDGPRGGEKLCQ
jgi:hypothetical protein